MDIVVSLVRRCKNNEKNAFHDLLTRFEAQLYRICYGSIYTLTRLIGLMPRSKLVKKTGNKVGTTINQQISNASKKLLKKMIGF